MATLSAQIQSLAGSVTESEIDQWCVDGVRELTNLFPPYLKEYCYSKQTFTSAAANSEAETMITGELGSVYAGSVECRQIRPMDKHKASSSTSIEYATATDPVYYVEGNKLNILPASLSGVYYVIADPSIDASAVSAISNFPNEAEYLVVLYAAIKVLQNKMNEKSRSDLSLDSVLPPIPPTPSFTTPTVGAITVSSTTLTNAGSPPIYVKPNSPSQTSFSDYWPITDLPDSDPGEFTISQAPPVAPSISSNSISFSTSAPTYSSQVVAPDFGDANTWLNTEEDSEMVGSRVQVIQSQIQDFQAKVQNELNVFNKENTEYQAQLQISIQNAQLAQSDEAQLLQKYSNELQVYQAEVNKQVQQYTQRMNRYQLELNTTFQAWSKTESDKLQKYQSDISNELNSFNRANAEYQTKLQEAVQQAQLDSQKASQQAQLDSQDAQQEASLLLQKETQEYSNKLQKYSTEVSGYQAEVGKKVQEFQQNFQKDSQEYQWLQSQQVKLQQDYNQGIQLLIGGGAPQQQQGER